MRGRLIKGTQPRLEHTAKQRIASIQSAFHMRKQTLWRSHSRHFGTFTGVNETVYKCLQTFPPGTKLELSYSAVYVYIRKPQGLQRATLWG